MNTTRLDGPRRCITETQARSNALAVEVAAMASIGTDSSERTRQLWDTLDALQRLRFDQWVLSQTPE